MAQPIFNMMNQLVRFAERVQYGLHDINVAALIARAYVIDFAGTPALEYTHDGAAMILNVNPIAHIAPVAVERDGLILKRVREYERDEFFRELSWTIVVSAARYDRVETVGVMRCVHHMLCCGFRCRVRIVRRKRRIFSEECVFVFWRTLHHLIGRYLH